MEPLVNDFQDLLARARQGEDSALDELARQYEPQLRLVARMLLGPKLRPYLDSVDLVQSVHKSLLIGLRDDRFDLSSPEKLVALALEMVRRKVGRHWRHLRRQERLEAGPAAADSVPDAFAALIDRSDPAPEAQLRDAVGHVCRHVTPAERQVLELRLEGHSTADVARRLGRDPDVLRVQLGRLRQRLRECGVLTEWL